jgi:hypothetical protein
MSADAGDANNGAVTGPGTNSPGTGGTATGDEGGAELLDGMLGNSDDQQGGDLAEQLRHWKEVARKNEQRAKQNAGAVSKLAKIEQANMSELEKAQAAQKEAELARDDALSSHARVLAAAANNLPVELIEHLGSGTEEEIGERAELFASIIESTAQAIAEQLIADQITSGQLIAGNAVNGNGRNGPSSPQGGGTRPVESLRAGSAPAGTAPNTNEQWFRNLLANS